MRTVDNQILTALHQIRDAIKNKDCCNGGGNTPSGDITIDDVVKFIHDDIVKNAHLLISEMFPYTTWNDIPDYKDANNGEVCKTKDIYDKEINNIMLSIPNYVIGIKGGEKL